MQIGHFSVKAKQKSLRFPKLFTDYILSSNFFTLFSNFLFCSRRIMTIEKAPPAKTNAIISISLFPFPVFNLYMYYVYPSHLVSFFVNIVKYMTMGGSGLSTIIEIYQPFKRYIDRIFNIPTLFSFYEPFYRIRLISVIPLQSYPSTKKELTYKISPFPLLFINVQIRFFTSRLLHDQSFRSIGR
jgi:hypothetical protein